MATLTIKFELRNPPNDEAALIEQVSDLFKDPVFNKKFQEIWFSQSTKPLSIVKVSVDES